MGRRQPLLLCALLYQIRPVFSSQPTRRIAVALGFSQLSLHSKLEEGRSSNSNTLDILLAEMIKYFKILTPQHTMVHSGHDTQHLLI